MRRTLALLTLAAACGGRSARHGLIEDTNETGGSTSAGGGGGTGGSLGPTGSTGTAGSPVNPPPTDCVIQGQPLPLYESYQLTDCTRCVCMPYGLDCDLSACSALTVCERLEPDYETALRRARWCGPIDVPAGVPYSYECTTSAPSHPACGCPVHVRNRVELDELARQWLENGCEKAQPCEPCVDFPGELTCGQDGWCRRGE